MNKRINILKNNKIWEIYNAWEYDVHEQQR